MIIIDGTKEIEYDGKTKIAIGKFDGVHLGHRKLISEITDGEKGYKSLVFTFSYDSLFTYRFDDKLMSEDERRKLFESLGVDYLVEYKLDKEAASIDPEKFVKDILIKRLHGAVVVAGADVSFGNRGMGNAALLKKIADDPNYDFSVKIIEKVQFKGEDISSSRIHDAIKEGASSDANDMLGL